MRRFDRSFGAATIGIAALLGATAVMAAGIPNAMPSISVPDLIRMRSIGDPAQLNYVDQDEGYFYGQWSNGHQSAFSPDGKHVAIIVRWGDLAANVTRAQVWIYDVRSIFSGAPHRVVVSAASSSNRPPIQSVRWLADNRTIAYLAEQPKSLPQVYLTDTKTGRTRQVTHSRELIDAFDITSSGKRVAFLARSLRRSETSGLSTHGAVKDLNLTDILTHEPEVNYAKQLSHLFVQDVGHPQAVPIADPRVATLLSSHSVTFIVGRCNPLFGGVSISPDGKYAVRICTLAGVPKSWARFHSVTPQFYPKRSTEAVSVYNLVDEDLERALQREDVGLERMSIGMSGTYLMQNIAVNIHTGRYHVVVDAPLSIRPWNMERRRTWLPRGHTLIIANSLAPDPRRFPLRPDTSNLIRVNLRSGHTVVQGISTAGGFPTGVRWDRRREGLSVDFNSPLRKLEEARFYTYLHGRWVFQAGVHTVAENSNGVIKVYVREGLDQPPRLMAERLDTGASKEILDVNPFLHRRRIGRISFVYWSRRNITWKARIYYPPDFRRGERYPLVIQTHGLSDGRRFTLDGDFSTGMAAEPLAAAGIVVVQLGTYGDQVGHDGRIVLPHGLLWRSEEHWIEALIHSLAIRGLIRKSRVGLSGFSSTCIEVKYFLTHSKYPIAAALVADGYDGGYLQYVTTQSTQAYMEAPNSGWGGMPYSTGLRNWLNESPDFRLENLHTPLRIEANRPAGLVWQWEAFAGLSRLGRAVVLHYMPEGSHEEAKPANWYASAQGAVDWYRFWLLDAPPEQLHTASVATWQRLRREYDTTKSMPALQWEYTRR